jgi:antitoxin component YwqK of YwqJK toxin-antitoxin module
MSVFYLGDCTVNHELRMEEEGKTKKTGEEARLAIKTASTRSADQACAICYYDSAAEEKDENLEREFSKATIDPHLKRYGTLCIAADPTDTTSNPSYCNVCSHWFHTSCLYKWVRNDTGGFTCPICRGGLQKQRLTGIPDMYEEQHVSRAEQTQLIVSDDDDGGVFDDDDVIDDAEEQEARPMCVRTYWDNGTLQKEYFTVRGKREGLFTSYYMTGHLELRCIYKDDMKEGTETHHYDDVSRQIKSQVDFVRDQKHGWSRWYTSHGKLIGRAQYKDGQKNGEHIEWYTDEAEPRLRSVEHHLEGKRHGIFMKWSFTGVLLLYGVYVNDEKDGRFCAWWENQQQPQSYGLRIKEFYINGLRHGMSAEYYEPAPGSSKPHPKEVGTYDHGARVGLWRTYWSSGHLKTECEYNAEGQCDGLYREWNRFGKLIKVFRFENDKLDGVCETFDTSLPPNVPIESATYRNGELHGLYVSRYKRTGKPKIIKNFINDREVFMRWLSRSGETLTEFRNGIQQPVPNSSIAEHESNNPSRRQALVNSWPETNLLVEDEKGTLHVQKTARKERKVMKTRFI